MNEWYSVFVYSTWYLCGAVELYCNIWERCFCCLAYPLWYTWDGQNRIETHASITQYNLTVP